MQYLTFCCGMDLGMYTCSIYSREWRVPNKIFPSRKYRTSKWGAQKVTLCAIWYHLYSLKNVINTHEGVVLLVKLQALRKVSFRHGCFLVFKNVRVPNCAECLILVYSRILESLAGCCTMFLFAVFCKMDAFKKIR